uniref:DNA-directed RNA polymerase I subunit rpa49-like n=1 Tax=Erigeron canadensis TaxID=72917 RepID=UPI001CB91D19|nr:DNA-directed RNA polymerase I subunit rpa49-like [Erigeron canadensis]
MGKKHKNTIIEEEEEESPMSQHQKENFQQTPPKKKHKKTHKVKIETINTTSSLSDKSLPLIGYFPSGYDPNESSLKKQPGVKLMRHVKRSNRLQLVVSPAVSSQVQFVGTNYSGEAAAPQACSYALGILDKDTNTLKIVQIESNKIFRLEPKFGNEEEDDAADEVSNVVEDKATIEETQAKYNFSTRKAELTAKKERARRSHGNPEAQEDLNNKMADAMVNTEALKAGAATTNIARNIPPYDMSATLPQEAYPLHMIISKGEWRYLRDIAELLQKGRDITPDAYPQFVCNRIHNIETVKDEEAKEVLACIFSYINHLIKFKDKHSMDGFSSAKHHKLPNILNQKFNDMFGNTESKRLADDKRDLLISYVLVLTLFADKFRTEFTDIAKDLRMSTGALRTHFQFLGCKFIRENNLTLATLPAPLKFPEVTMKRRR